MLEYKYVHLINSDTPFLHFLPASLHTWMYSCFLPTHLSHSEKNNEKRKRITGRYAWIYLHLFPIDTPFLHFLPASLHTWLYSCSPPIHLPTPVLPVWLTAYIFALLLYISSLSRHLYLSYTCSLDEPANTPAFTCIIFTFPHLCNTHICTHSYFMTKEKNNG